MNQKRNVQLIYVERTQLNKNDLVKIAKQHISPGANAIAVYKPTLDGIRNTIKEISDGGAFDPIKITENVTATYIYIAYMKDGELINEEENCYINIRAASIARDLDELFKDNEMLVLK